MTLRRALLVLGVAGTLALPARASAQEEAPRPGAWCIVVEPNPSLPPGTAETYRSLLEGEVSAQLHPTLVYATPPEGCRDVGCERAAAAGAGARMLLLAGVHPLGSHFVATAQLIDTTTGEAQPSQRITIEHLEELDVAASRLARAIATGKSADETATLGTVTQKEERPDRRRQGSNGAALRVVASVPVGNGLGPSVVGVGFALGYWVEFRHFAIEPSFGAQFSSPDTAGSYQHVAALDLAGNYIFSDEDFSPFLGGALGVHFLHEQRQAHLVSGSVLETTSNPTVDSTVWGPGLTARAGVMLLRTYAVRMTAAIEYTAVIGSSNDLNNPQSLGLSVGVVF